MQRILLLGAGFSRNWGGWLASEAFEYLLGAPEVQEDLRNLLWKHQRKGGFEDALAELQQSVERDPHGPFKTALEALRAAVLRMFKDMNKALAERDWEFTGHMDEPLSGQVRHHLHPESRRAAGASIRTKCPGIRAPSVSLSGPSRDEADR